MKKKQLDVVIRINDADTMRKYVAPEYNKLVCINVFDKFWGACEVLDPVIKKFQENKDNVARVDFVSADREITGELFHKGNIVSFIDGIDFPKLQEEFEKSFSLLDAE